MGYVLRTSSCGTFSALRRPLRVLAVRVLVRVVVVVEVLAVAAVRVGPLHLGLEGVVLLAEVLLPEVVGVDAAPVPPLEHLVRRVVDVLEVLVLAVAAGAHRDVRGVLVAVGHVVGHMAAVVGEGAARATATQHAPKANNFIG